MLSRGQTFDVLSSQANIAGYRAVVEASNVFGRFFAGQMTTRQKVPPAKVLVLGAGVAGLAAIQTAKAWAPSSRRTTCSRWWPSRSSRSAGSSSACRTRRTARRRRLRQGDVRRVQGRRAAAHASRRPIITPPSHRAALSAADPPPRAHRAVPSRPRRLEQVGDADIVVTTALIPNRPAPELIKQEMVDAMRRGSVIVDLAAENGGNALHAGGQGGRHAERRHASGTPTSSRGCRRRRPPPSATTSPSSCSRSARRRQGTRASTTSTTTTTPSGGCSPSTQESSRTPPPYNPPEAEAAARAAPPPPPVPEWKKYASCGEAHRIVGAPHRHGHVGRPAARRPPHDVCALRPRRLAGRRRRPSGAPLAAHVGH